MDHLFDTLMLLAAVTGAYGLLGLLVGVIEVWGALRRRPRRSV